MAVRVDRRNRYVSRHLDSADDRDPGPPAEGAEGHADGGSWLPSGRDARG